MALIVCQTIGCGIQDQNGLVDNALVVMRRKGRVANAGVCRLCVCSFGSPDQALIMLTSFRLRAERVSMLLCRREVQYAFVGRLANELSSPLFVCDLRSKRSVGLSDWPAMDWCNHIANNMIQCGDTSHLANGLQSRLPP